MRVQRNVIRSAMAAQSLGSLKILSHSANGELVATAVALRSWRLRAADRAGGPQDPDKVSARWRTVRRRLGLPELFRLHDSRASKINNDLDVGENPVEVAANARHHNPGYTMRAYGRRRADPAKKLAGASAARIGLATRLATKGL
jgi:hypothetical protein